MTCRREGERDFGLLNEAKAWAIKRGASLGYKKAHIETKSTVDAQVSEMNEHNTRLAKITSLRR